ALDLVVEQQPAEQRLLRFEGVRRQLEGVELGVVRHRWRAVGTGCDCNASRASCPIARTAEERKKRAPSGALLRCGAVDQPCTVSPTTLIAISVVTSVCSATPTRCSPTCFSGPVGMRIADFSTVKPCAF